MYSKALLKAQEKLQKAIRSGASDKKIATLEWNVRYLQAINK